MLDLNISVDNATPQYNSSINTQGEKWVEDKFAEIFFDENDIVRMGFQGAKGARRRVPKARSLCRGVGGHAPPENFEKMKAVDAFWWHFGTKS